jgi:3-oxoacyl-[acyl-carrier-protein] synthase-3
VREYFEPAVATEVAWRLGAGRALAFDVVAACAGPLVAIDTLRGRAATDPDWDLAVVSTASLNDGFIGFNIQDPDELDELAAGLTIGQATTATLIGRRPFANGGRILGSFIEGVPSYHSLCKAPLFGVFRSAGTAMFALAALVPSHVERACARVGWKVSDVDLFVFHQPSDRILREVAKAMGIPRERMPGLHHVYGNTEASAVPLTLRHVANAGGLRPGMKILMGSAAAGFTIGTVAVEWMGPG